MRIRIGLLTFACAVGITTVAVHAQSTAAHDRPEVAIAYNYVHSNAPAGGCGCFSLNGGSATVAFPLHRAGLSLVGDISATHAGSISSTAQDLTLTTFTAGIRYSLPPMHTRLRPFAEVLVGGAHGSGSLVSSGASFASLLGGGVDLRATHRFSLRLVEADYLVTTFDNGSNNHQNNLRIATGVVLHF